MPRGVVGWVAAVAFITVFVSAVVVAVAAVDVDVSVVVRACAGGAAVSCSVAGGPPVTRAGPAIVSCVVAVHEVRGVAGGDAVVGLVPVVVFVVSNMDLG